MEEEAPPRRSVAELAGRFKDPSAARSRSAANEADKPVRRRPPRTLQLPTTHTDQQEPPPSVTSPLPAKAKRNSALIEKLQANLALSPSATPPKSPSFRLLPPTFGPPSPAGSAPTSSAATPTSPVDASPLTGEEGPASFEAPPTAAEGCILLSINKGRIRHSVRRRPPSRRHRKSSHEEDDTDAQRSSSGGGGGGGDGGGGGGGGDPSTLHLNQLDEEETRKNVGEEKEGGASSKLEETQRRDRKTEDTREESEQEALGAAC